MAALCITPETQITDPKQENIDVFSRCWYNSSRVDFEWPSKLDRTNFEPRYGLLKAVSFRADWVVRVGFLARLLKSFAFYQSPERFQIHLSPKRRGRCFPGDGEVQNIGCFISTPRTRLGFIFSKKWKPSTLRGLTFVLITRFGSANWKKLKKKSTTADQKLSASIKKFFLHHGDSVD